MAILARFHVQWIKCKGGRWCTLSGLRLSTVREKAGIYIIWHDCPLPRAVRIGQSGAGRTGSIRARLSEHRNNEEILHFDERRLYVTWAAVPDAQQRKGIENYLGRVLVPRVGSRFPRVAPVEVNLPWRHWHRPRGSQLPLGSER